MTQLSYEVIAARIQTAMENSITQAPEAFGSRLQMAYLPTEDGTYCFSARMDDWMCNPGGMIHGGVCAGLVDQAMGIVVYCITEGKTIAPTIGLQINYHRPLLPKTDVQIRVRTISVTRHLISMAADIVCAENSERLYVSSTATFFCKESAQDGK